jgi:two-component system LytT family sensor kinase
MSIEVKTKRRWSRWSILFVSFTLIGLLFAGRNIVAFISRGRSIDWGPGVLFEIIYWYLWALFTPLIFWYAGRFPIERRNWPRRAAALVIFGLIVAPVQVSLEIAINLTLAAKVFHMPAAELAQRLALIDRIILVESFTGFLTYAVIVGVSYAFDFYQKYRERDVRASELKSQLARAELQNLKMQLHPHFLFNTLNTISVLMVKDTRAANRMLVHLSDLLRSTLETVGTHEVTLKQELEFLERYLEIERTRFQDRLSVEMKVEPEVLDARVPNLILQPLVENAIRHGIAPLLASGMVEINARRENGMVQLEVRDNGPGINGASGLKEGVGLSNTRARLVQLYGKDHRFELHNTEGGGLLVCVAIPFHVEDDKA